MRRKNERGASAMEYGLLVALCALAMMVSMQVLGGSLSTVYMSSCSGQEVRCEPAP